MHIHRCMQSCHAMQYAYYDEMHNPKWHKLFLIACFQSSEWLLVSKNKKKVSCNLKSIKKRVARTLFGHYYFCVFWRETVMHRSSSMMQHSIFFQFIILYYFIIIICSIVGSSSSSRFIQKKYSPLPRALCWCDDDDCYQTAAMDFECVWKLYSFASVGFNFTNN